MLFNGIMFNLYFIHFMQCNRQLIHLLFLADIWRNNEILSSQALRFIYFRLKSMRKSNCFICYSFLCIYNSFDSYIHWQVVINIYVSTSITLYLSHSAKSHSAAIECKTHKHFRNCAQFNLFTHSLCTHTIHLVLLDTGFKISCCGL